MSTDNFVKGECGACGGHLEFPADAVGTVIACPHCGGSTGLTARVATPQHTGPRRMYWGMGLVVLFLAAALGLVKMPGHAPGLKPVVQTNAVPASDVALFGVRTNDFGITAIRLDKTPGSSLVYASGTVRNLGGRQRFSVRLELELFDADDHPVGRARDYRGLIEPGAEWHFQALVMDSTVASARLNSILEDR